MWLGAPRPGEGGVGRFGDGAFLKSIQDSTETFLRPAIHRIMTTIAVYKIDTAKGKLPRDAEVHHDANIENGFVYARDLPRDQQNYNYYAVTEDDDLKLFTIGDQFIAKEGTMLFMPVGGCPSTRCPSKYANTYACISSTKVFAGVPGQAHPAVPRSQDMS